MDHAQESQEETLGKRTYSRNRVHGEVYYPVERLLIITQKKMRITAILILLFLNQMGLITND